MQFGHFDDENKEYVITTPKTPYPWINYLGSQDFFSLISNTAGGYCFYRDARFRRLTRYRYNNVPLDDGGRYFYIQDGDTIWSPGWKPCRTDLDAYECRHGLGYTQITGQRNGLSASVLFLVPLDENLELHRLRIENLSDRHRSVRIFSLIEWCLWNAEDDMTNFQRNLSTGEVEVDGSVIYHKTGFRERRNHYAWYGVNHELSGFDTCRDTFLGPYNGFDRPAAVLRGRAANSIAHGWSPIASHCIELGLQPGESRELVFQLGYAELPEARKWSAPDTINKTPARECLERYGSGAAVQAALDALEQHWDELLARFRLRSGEARLDRMVNIWNPYQCMVTFNLSRSASYFEAGIGRGMGFRDSNQDLLGAVHLAPARARARVLDLAATQFEHGGVYHQYQPLTKRGNSGAGDNFNDDPLWLIQSTAAYVKETGDFSILDERVPFAHDETRTGGLLEHLQASFDRVANRLGPHGLPLIGRADWNDCLNLNCFSNDPNESFQTTNNKMGRTAESLMIAGLFVLYGKEFIKLSREVGKNDEADQAQRKPVLDQRYVHHAAQRVARVALDHLVDTGIDPARERAGIGLVRDDAQRAALRCVAEQGALRTAQRLDPRDVDHPHVGVAAGHRDRLFVEIDRAGRAAAEGEPGDRAAAHENRRAAGLTPAESQPRDLADVIIDGLEALPNDILFGERGNGDRHILQAGFALRRGNDDFFELGVLCVRYLRSARR